MAPAPRTPSPKKPKAAKSSKSPTNKGKGIRERQKEWIDGLLPKQWIPISTFMHPEGTETITKGDAGKIYKLKKEELGILPFERSISKDGYPMFLYSITQVRNLTLRKCKVLEVPWPVPQPKPAPPKPWETNPPLIIKDYTCPSGAKKPDPSPILWLPDRLSAPIPVRDACRLYCIEPSDIQDLSDHSPWIDLETVAKRAVAMHGGFHAHEAFLLQCRKAEEEQLLEEDRQRTTPSYEDPKSHFQFSPVVEKEMMSDKEHQHYSDLYGTPGSYEYRRQRTVAVLHPIVYAPTNDYGTNPEWVPCWGDF
ncbi:hypothetical protein R3P38DRAFT_3273124 [Favolaschia claudopus]|uniref:Uncharacterized protein n=1 Tax=Favolaschia claudopus TaxID=2862362 RepID=A0AAW0B3Y9_9AGAR